MARTLAQQVSAAQDKALKEISRLESIGFQVPQYVKDNIAAAPAAPTKREAQRYINRADLAVIRGTATTEYVVTTPQYAFFDASGRQKKIQVPEQRFRVPYHMRDKAAQFVYSRVREDLMEAAGKVPKTRLGRTMGVTDVFEREADAAGLSGATAKRPPSAAKLEQTFGFQVSGDKQYGGELKSDFFLLFYGSPRPQQTLNKEAARVIREDQTNRTVDSLVRASKSWKNGSITREEAEHVFFQLYTHPEWKILMAKMAKVNMDSDQIVRYYTQEARPKHKLTGAQFIRDLIKWIDGAQVKDIHDIRALFAAKYGQQKP